MLTERIQLIVAVMILAFLIVLFELAKKKFMDPKYTLAWFLVTVGVMILDLIPDAMKYLSKLIGIYNPMNMVFFIGFIYMAFIIFALSIAMSRLSGRVKKLIQEVAILNRELEDRTGSKRK